MEEQKQLNMGMYTIIESLFKSYNLFKVVIENQYQEHEICLKYLESDEKYKLCNEKKCVSCKRNLSSEIGNIKFTYPCKKNDNKKHIILLMVCSKKCGDELINQW